MSALWTQLNDWYSINEDLSVQNLGSSGLYQLLVNDYFVDNTNGN